MPSPSTHFRLLARTLFVGLTLVGLAGLARAQGRVVMLGFDGADARTTQKLIDDGQLPNLARLAEEGTFAPLVSSNPAESAAGWVAINTGVSPVENNVPSFIKRAVSGSSVRVTTGHTTNEDKPIEEFKGSSGLLGLLISYDEVTLVGVFGLLVALVFFIVFGLLLRVKKSVAMILALLLGGVGGWGATRARTYVPQTIPRVFINLADAPPFWEFAAQGGAESIVLDAAMAFDREDVPGARVLGGLGLPDLRGGQNGEWLIYTTDEFETKRVPEGRPTKPSSAGTVFRVSEREGKISSFIYGPKNFYPKGVIQAEIDAIDARIDADHDMDWKTASALRDQQDELRAQLDEVGDERLSVPFTVQRVGDKVDVTIDGHKQNLGDGEWSDWYGLAFKINPLLTANAVTRVKILSLEEPFTMFVNNLEIDPRNPIFWQPLSSPASFSAELADWIGSPYETTGWSCMTNQLKDKELDAATFLEDIEFTMKWREELTYAALERNDWRLLFSVFSTTDRVQHMLYEYYDPGHPQYDAEAAATQVTFFDERIPLSDAIPAIYRQMDRIVGTVRERFLSADDTLLLCADHGFSSFRRELHVNNFLCEAGYLVLKEGVSKSDGSILDNYVDWSRTKAYSLGLGMIYLNLEGREPSGIVKPEEADAILEQIAADFLALTDTGEKKRGEIDESIRGTKVGVDAVNIRKIYGDGSGDKAWGTLGYPCADMMLGMAQNYRISWSTVSAKIRLAKGEDGETILAPMFQDNTSNWSGDHASNSPDLVTGIFFSSEPVDVPADGVSVLHLAPTILDRLGITPPESLDREPLAATSN